MPDIVAVLYLAESRVQFWAAVSTVINIWVTGDSGQLSKE